MSLLLKTFKGDNIEQCYYLHQNTGPRTQWRQSKIILYYIYFET